MTTTVIGIDVGGTFTDVFAIDEATGEFRVAKVPSTRGEEELGFLAGVNAAVDSFDRIGAVVHGTTVGTNALLERKGATTGIITTAGFADVLEMRRRDRPNTWGLWGDFTPIVDRDRRLEVDERTGADGSIVAEVDPAHVIEQAKVLLDSGADACCIAFINAYANDHNETVAVEAVRSVWPNEHVTSAVQLLPEVREFERTSTAALNAYLQPVVGGYVERLEVALADGGFDGRFFIVQSNGGVMTSTAARALPVRTALSGPAAGVIASAHLAAGAGYANVITCDMGGTSFDVAVIADGEVVSGTQTSVDYGLVIRTPMIEISTIGAGGGSLAWVDGGGILRIGPESAGSVPGPACYGRGNDRPTVTDAHLVLGRVNGDRPIGGLDRLDLAAARAAVERDVATPLGLTIEDAAEAILRIATSRMAGALRLVSIERGHDPGDFVAMPVGGAGALHACGLLADVGLSAALVPRYPGVTSALGCTIADARHDVVQTLNLAVDALESASEVAGLAERLRASEEAVRGFLDDSGMVLDDVTVSVDFDMSYVGQTHTVQVPIADGSALDADAIMARFEEKYGATYGQVLDGISVRILSARTTVVGTRPKIEPSALAPPESGIDPAHERRPVFFDGGWHDTRIWPRLELPVGWKAAGPAILEQSDATIVIDPGFSGEVDALGNIIVKPTG
ncbi:MAG: hydantoinase/oxoprolinase family protein [Acidimicrobiales bacterium]